MFLDGFAVSKPSVQVAIGPPLEFVCSFFPAKKTKALLSTTTSGSSLLRSAGTRYALALRLQKRYRSIGVRFMRRSTTMIQTKQIHLRTTSLKFPNRVSLRTLQDLLQIDDILGEDSTSSSLQAMFRIPEQSTHTLWSNGPIV